MEKGKTCWMVSSEYIWQGKLLENIHFPVISCTLVKQTAFKPFNQFSIHYNLQFFHGKIIIKNKKT